MKIVFMGTPAPAAVSLERLIGDGHEIAAVYTQPDKPAGRGNKISFSPVKEYALQHELPILQPLKIKTAEALETFKSHNADLVVVVAYGRILPETFLQAFPKGAVNVHFSLLPKYRGAAPVNWAIAGGEEKSGVTTMRMDAGLDTGGILLQREIAIGESENAVELMARLAILGADLLSETLAMFDELTAQPQDDSQATFAPIMKKEDGVIDWNAGAILIVNRVRAFQPFPTSHTKYQDKKLTIWKAAIVTEFERRSARGGEVLAAKSDELIIACGDDTALRIEELQLEGKKRMTVRDFLNGIKMRVGDQLG